MSDQSYTTAFLVDQTPKEVFAAINNVRGWWFEELEGQTDELGEFKNYEQGDLRCNIKITQLVPGKKVAWHVEEFNYVSDPSEWKDTDIVFEIARKGDQTEVRFTHVGLVPAFECYSGCSHDWGIFINSSLRNLITTGEDQPNPFATKA
jgi:hypothetical protein